MRSLGFQEVLVVVVVALLIFGPERLPELARNAGKFLARFRAETSKSLDELRRAADIQDLERELRSVTSELRETKRSLTQGFTDVGASIAGVGKAAQLSDTMGEQTRRAVDAPAPPLDPEAT